MRQLVVALGVWTAAFCAGCHADVVTEKAHEAGPSEVACGPATARQADGTCLAVGPVLSDANLAALTRAEDGWGMAAVAASGCGPTEMAVLGSAACAPVDDCSAPFPPADADVVVGAAIPGAESTGSLAAALEKVKPGGIVAVGAGTYPAIQVGRDVTIVGHCAKDTFIGLGDHNAIYVDTPHVTVRSVTLTSADSSALAVQTGHVDADRVILRQSPAAMGAVGSQSSITLTHGLVLGPGKEASGGMAAQGGRLIVLDSEIRGVTTGLLATDATSLVQVKRGVISVEDDATATGLEASAEGRLEAESMYVRSTAARLAAPHQDVGTLGSSTPRSGVMTITDSVLEQSGAELTDAPAIAASDDGASLTLTDVTLRHQSRIGVLVGKGAATLTRVAILGDRGTTALRAAVMVIGGTVDATGLAVPWAQGVGLGADKGATLNVDGSLVSGVVRRDSAQEAVLVSRSTATFTGTEISKNEEDGVVAIGGSTVAMKACVVSDGVGAGGDASFGAVLLHSSGTIDGCLFERNREAVVAAGSAVLVTGGRIKSHAIAFRAMDGMALREGASDLADDSLAYTGCTFDDVGVKTSTETLPQLDASPFPGLVP